eukprot:PhF_6_TR36485/c0_g1_i1/m.53604
MHGILREVYLCLSTETLGFDCRPAGIVAVPFLRGLGVGPHDCWRVWSRCRCWRFVRNTLWCRLSRDGILRCRNVPRKHWNVLLISYRGSCTECITVNHNITESFGVLEILRHRRCKVCQYSVTLTVGRSHKI